MSRFKAYAQLVRLPNVFTAFADVALGALAVIGVTGETANAAWYWSLLAIMASSGSLYSAGMVWNDYFDVEQDRRERPFRPIPSGRVSRRRAGVLAVALTLSGLAFAALAGIGNNTFVPHAAIIAGMLAAAIFLYDAWLKRTPLGPLGMGLCRFLNVMLGLCATVGLSEQSLPIEWLGIHLAGIVGLYIVGVTWFARTEARESQRRMLASAAMVMISSVFAALALPLSLKNGWPPIFLCMLAVACAFVGPPVISAIVEPTPVSVQIAVKRAIFGLVILDAALATAFVGPVGLIILLLLLPAMFLGRWIYST